MRRITIIALLAALFFAPAAVEAADPSVLAPYRFQPSDLPLTAVDRARALVYRNQLKSKLKSLDRADAAGDLQGMDRCLLLDVRKELGRMDGIARRPPARGLGLPTGRTLPSLSNGLFP